MIESPDYLFSFRYDAYRKDHGIFFDQQTTRTSRIVHPLLNPSHSHLWVVRSCAWVPIEFWTSGICRATVMVISESMTETTARSTTATRFKGRIQVDPWWLVAVSDLSLCRRLSPVDPCHRALQRGDDCRMSLAGAARESGDTEFVRVA